MTRMTGRALVNSGTFAASGRGAHRSLPVVTLGHELGFLYGEIAVMNAVGANANGGKRARGIRAREEHVLFHGDDGRTTMHTGKFVKLLTLFWRDFGDVGRGLP